MAKQFRIINKKSGPLNITAANLEEVAPDIGAIVSFPGFTSLLADYAFTDNSNNWDSAYTDRFKWDGGSSGLVATTGRTSLGATTVGSNVFTLPNPSAITFLRFNANNTVSALNASDFRTAIGAGTSSTVGTVTSIAMSVPTGLAVTGSPITTSGTFGISLDTGYSIPTTLNQTNWNTAYGWGNHEGLYSVTGHTHTLQSILDAGNYAESPDAQSYAQINLSDTGTSFDFFSYLALNYTQIQSVPTEINLLSISNDYYSNLEVNASTGFVLETRTFTGSKELRFRIGHPLNSNVNVNLVTPSSGLDNATYYVPLSVNNNFADSDGNITTPAETDPVFIASQAANITSQNITDLGNLSGVNSGDQDLSGYQTLELAKLKQDINTGFISGLQLSINADNTKFDIAAGYYVITDFTDLLNPVPQIINFAGVTGVTPTYLASANASYIALNVGGTVIQSSSPFTNTQRRDLAIIGAVIHSNNSFINVVNQIKAPIVGDVNQLHDLMRVIGAINRVGNEYSANGANLSLNRSAGEVFGLGLNPDNPKDPSTLIIPEEILVSFRYRMSNGDESADTTLIAPTQIESPLGTLVALSNNNKYSIQRINLFQSGLTRIQYGQKEYADFNDALLNVQTENFITEQNIAENAIFRAYLVMKKDVTDLAAAITAGTAKFIPVDKWGSVVGGAGTALTYDSILAALGFTPEDVANKQDSLTVDGTGVKYPTVDSVNFKNDLQDVEILELDTRVFNLENGTVNTIQVSAIWTTGLSFSVTAASFPVLDTYYSATSDTVTLNTSDGTYGRFDFIVAYASGTVGKLIGTPSANPADPDDFDPSTMYLIKRVLVPAGATVPFGVSKTLVFNEGVGTPTEFAFSTNSSGRIEVTANDFHLDLNAIEATNVLIGDYFDLTYSSVLSTTNIGVITFWIKLKANFGNNSIVISFANAGVSVGGLYWFKNGENGFVQNNLDWQKITIDESKLNLPVSDFDSIRIRPYKQFAGYFIDEVNFNVGSGITVNVINPLTYLDLTDTDNSYAGHAGKVPKVNVGETALAFENLTKSDVGLSNVDNTSDANKPVSTAQQTALDAKLDDTDALTTVTPTNKLITEDDIAGLGGGDMLKSTYDPTNVNSDAFATDNFKNATVAKTTPIDADNLTLWDSVSSSFKKVTWANIKATLKDYFDTLYATVAMAKTEYMLYACSDETTDLVLGDAISIRMPYAMTLSEVRTSLNEAPTITKFIVDVKEGGVSIFSTLPSIDTAELTSVTASVPAVISDASLADNALLVVSVTQLGSGDIGKGLKILFIGQRA